MAGGLLQHPEQQGLLEKFLLGLPSGLARAKPGSPKITPMYVDTYFIHGNM